MVGADINKIEYYKKLSDSHREGLYKLGIKSVRDLLYYQPVRYVQYGEGLSAANVKSGELATLYGTLKKVTVRKSWKSKINMTEATFTDGVSNIKLFWFNQPYIGKMYPENSLVMISGKLSGEDSALSMSNPNIEKINAVPEMSDSLFNNTNESTLQHLIPIYNETRHVTSKFLHELIKKVIKSENFDKLVTDMLPEYIKAELHLPGLREAVLYSHLPTDKSMAEAAKKRFLFEEMFLVQLKIAREKHLAKESLAYVINDPYIEEFFALHGITPTNAQNKVLADMLADLKSGRPMQRLLEGDVGSGKTLVAAALIYSVIKSKRDNKKIGTPLQAVYLAPTEVLALQQYEGLIQLLAHTGISVGYLSGKQAYKFPSKADPESYTAVSKPQLLKWVTEGQVSLLVGTHAVTKKKVTFKDLSLIIIDEQHRFGINTRRDLAHKKGDSRPEIPHLLSMTATPIPRTLALSIFGDLDLSIIDELPKGRQKIKTILAPERDRKKMYEQLLSEVQSGRQAYVVCTKIALSEEESEDKKERRSVESELLSLQKFLDSSEHDAASSIKIAGLHGKISSDKRDEVMSDFKENKIQVLIATSLVEVGVNVPNATIMLIEDADRFGMSQLHQLRGRIGRGMHPSTCILFSSSVSEVSVNRLRNFCSTTSGFELAELDMRERGIGSLLSSNQSGMSDLGMQALQNLKLVEVTKKYAYELVREDAALENFPSLAHHLNKFDDVHME